MTTQLNFHKENFSRYSLFPHIKHRCGQRVAVTENTESEQGKIQYEYQKAVRRENSAVICIKKEVFLPEPKKNNKINKLQERVKALERTNEMLEEMYEGEETAKDKVLEKYNTNKSKWQKERNMLLKANKEILKMMEHIDKQIANVKGKH